MKKINWKVRLKNPIFWATFGASLVAFVYTVLSLFDITPAFSQDIVIKAITTLISANYWSTSRPYNKRHKRF